MMKTKNFTLVFTVRRWTRRGQFTSWDPPSPADFRAAATCQAQSFPTSRARGSETPRCFLQEHYAARGKRALSNDACVVRVGARGCRRGHARAMGAGSTRAALGGRAGGPGWKIHRSRRGQSVKGAAGTDRPPHGPSAGWTARGSITRVLGNVRRDVPRDVRRRAGGNGYLLGGRKSKGGSPRSPRASEEGADKEGEESPEGDENQNETRLPATARQRLRYALSRVDSDGYWAVISSGIVFGTFLLESYNMSSFGGWDVLYREDISPWYTGLISMNALEDIEDAYNVLFFFEFCLRAWAFEFKKEFWSNPVTAVDFLATIPPVLSFFGIIERGSPVFRFLRLLRVLRLLRLLDRNPDSVLFGLGAPTPWACSSSESAPSSCASSSSPPASSTTWSIPSIPT